MSMDITIQEIAKLDPVHLYRDGVDGVLEDIRQHAKAVDFDPATPEGRETGKSIAYKVARSKTLLDDMGKKLVEGIKKEAGEIDKKRKTVRDTLDALRDEIKKPVEEWEQADRVRKDAIEAQLDAIAALGKLPFGVSLEEIDDRIFKHNNAPVPPVPWGEYQETARDIGEAVLKALTEAREVAVKRAAELAELEVLRAEQRRRDQDETDRLAAEDRAARVKDIAFTQLYNEAHFENRAIDAAAAAVENERKRVAAQAEADRAAETKREANKRHRAKVHNAIVADLVQATKMDVTMAQTVVVAIAQGDICNVKITY